MSDANAPPKSEAERRAAVNQLSRQLIEQAVAVARQNGFDDYFVATMLLTAAGLFSYTMPERATFFRAVHEFLQSTHSAYPEFRYEPVPFYNAEQQLAMQERQGKTVH